MCTPSLLNWNMHAHTHIYYLPPTWLAGLR
uniref:Uncharacterized protein n=1 Tax=Triticum urartu TaxID=4572 RepID=A0A8R7V2K3_TRIUA